METEEEASEIRGLSPHRTERSGATWASPSEGITHFLSTLGSAGGGSLEHNGTPNTQ